MNKFSIKKAIVAVAVVGMLGTQVVNAGWSGWRVMTIRSNQVTSGVTRTKQHPTTNFAIEIRNSTMWTNPSGRANNGTTPTSWILLNNGRVRTGTINSTVRRTYTLQIRGNALQSGVDTLDARLNVDH